MKKFFSILSLAVLALGAVPLVSQAQVTPRNLTTLTLSATTVATSTTATITSQAFPIKPDSGFAVVPNFVLSGADTANVTFNFAVSVDGTTWTTVTPFTYAVAANGTTPVIGFSNFAPHVTGAGANNIAYARLQSVTNASSTRTVTINSVTITRNN
ncbi:MAG: hypothetical protein NTV51_12205 [Verrucomicrobia bacterium]|nr:hypothetical protein [Verrucomicrobiota bacterium]